MAEQLKCDRCGLTYTDEGSIALAKKMKGEWEKLCRQDGVEPRGVCSCPKMCPGELILEEV